MAFELPKLAYEYVALEPHIDALTMEIHHSKHHAAYVVNLNNAIKDTPADKLSLEAILKDVSKYSVAVRNNAGGHYNHSLFWELIAPGGSNKPSDKLEAAIVGAFGSFDKFKELFSQAALSRFGSGWAWLIKKENGELAVVSTPNQDNPLMDVAETKGFPILGLDVWEHAYYLKYQNRRADYIASFWNIVNWDVVEKRFNSK
jgi:Fe-Mn family superoxide dismutase